jgi:hypothetical protein
MANNRNAALGIGVVGAALGAVTGLFLSNADNRRKLKGWYEDLLEDSKDAKEDFQSTAHQIQRGAMRRLESATEGRSKKRGRRKSRK